MSSFTGFSRKKFGGVSGNRSKQKGFSGQEQLLPAFLFSGMGRNDGLEHLTFNPWRRQPGGGGIASALVATGGVMGVAGAMTGAAGSTVGPTGMGGGRRYSRQLDIITSNQRRKSDSAARRSTAAAAASASAVSVMALHAAMGGGGGSMSAASGVKALPVKGGSLYDDENNCFNFEPDSLLFDHFNNKPSSGYRRDSRFGPGGAVGLHRPRDSMTGSSSGPDHRLIRRKKIVSALIIACVGLAVLSILLVTVLLRLAPSSSAAKEQKGLHESKMNNSFAGGDHNSTGSERYDGGDGDASNITAAAHVGSGISGLVRETEVLHILRYRYSKQTLWQPEG